MHVCGELCTAHSLAADMRVFLHVPQAQMQHGAPMTMPCGTMTWPEATGPNAHEYMHEPYAQECMSQPVVRGFPLPPIAPHHS